MPLERSRTPSSGLPFDESALLETVLATAPVGLGFLDRDLRFVRLNESLAAGNRRTVAEHLGRRIDEIWPEIPADLLTGLERLVETGVALTGHEVLTDAGGHPRYVLGSYYPVWNGDAVVGVGIVVVDITARRRAEDEARGLAREQAALRRVATLVASEAEPEQVFAAVSKEVAGVIGASSAGLVRYHEETGTVVGRFDEARLGGFELGLVLPLEGDSVIAQVHATEQPARIDTYAGLAGPVAELTHRLGYRSFAAAPVHVEGRLWGALLVGTQDVDPLPPDTERRLVDFAELVALAIGNAEARAELRASRARIVAAADAERRRLERELHDSAQQRLVALSLTLRILRAKLADDPDEATGLLAAAERELAQAIEELRELARGIHPPALADHGLAPAVSSLAARVPVPVDVSGFDVRLPAPLEAAFYFVVAEALANVVKYADASSVSVSLAEANGQALVEVVDDGVGGASAGAGSGLRGLADRLEALGGTLEIESPAGHGTRIRAAVPLA